MAFIYWYCFLAVYGILCLYFFVDQDLEVSKATLIDMYRQQFEMRRGFCEELLELFGQENDRGWTGEDYMFEYCWLKKEGRI